MMKDDRLPVTGCGAVSCSPPASPEVNEGFQAKVFKSAEGKSLNYRIHIPETLDLQKRYPLVIFFHGSGERGNNNKSQLVHGAKDMLAYSRKSNTPAFIVAPQCPADEQWVDTPWGAEAHTMPKSPSASMALAIALLQELQETLPIDVTRIYVSGLSMGGFGAWDIVQRMPETFAAVMPICGGGDTAMASALKNIPIWIFHGGSDQVVKTTRSRDMAAALHKVGGKVKYTEYEGVEHCSWGKVYTDEEALKWFFSQKKRPATEP